MLFSIDYRSREPIYEQLYHSVIQMLSLGVLETGQQLPPVRQLAAELGINPNTVSKAYKNLENDGIICSVVGKGSFIAENHDVIDGKKEELLKSVTENLTQAHRMGIAQTEIQAIIRRIYNGGGNTL